jgi:response regulator RpfG family c-di-GMP phosphodiesterase
MNDSHTLQARVSIIFIENDSCLRKMMEMVLSNNFQIVTAQTAETGLALLETAGPFDIVIASFTLSGMNGLKFLLRVGEQYPETVRVLMTGGCADMDSVQRAVNSGQISRLVLKPFCMSTLQEQLINDLALARAT